MLSEEAVKEFQELYKNEYGIDLSPEEAYSKGLRLLRLYKAVFKPKDNKDGTNLAH